MLPSSICWYATKGGVGKSTHTAHHAALAAAGGESRVLTVDLDHQGSLGRLLGYAGRDDYDGGASLASALRGQGAPSVLHGVRPGLDSIGGGPELAGIADYLGQQLVARPGSGWRTFADALQPAAQDYDLILVDLPPTPSPLHTAALAAVHYLVLPTTTDSLGVDGVAFALSLFGEIRHLNPHLEVYRRYFDAYLVLGRDPSRSLDDPSLSAVTTAAFRQKVQRNLDGLRRNSIRLQGDVVLSLRSANVTGDRATLLLCIRDDVDQYDATGKQLTPPGPGKPEVLEAGLAGASGVWIVDSSRTTGEPCDV